MHQKKSVQIFNQNKFPARKMVIRFERLYLIIYYINISNEPSIRYQYRFDDKGTWFGSAIGNGKGGG